MKQESVKAGDLPECPFRPVNDKIIVKVAKPLSKIGSILMPQNAQKRVFRGTVIAVGPGKLVINQETGKTFRLPIDVKVGDKVHFSRFAGNELERDEDMVKDDEDRTIAMTQEDLLAIEV